MQLVKHNLEYKDTNKLTMEQITEKNKAKKEEILEIEREGLLALERKNNKRMGRRDTFVD